MPFLVNVWLDGSGFVPWTAYLWSDLQAAQQFIASSPQPNARCQIREGSCPELRAGKGTIVWTSQPSGPT